MTDKKSSDIAKKECTELDVFNDKVKAINVGLKSIVRNFFKVGKYLGELKESKIFKVKGYKNFIEFTKFEFGLSKDQSYRLINIYKKFGDDKYSNFSYSQLTEMLSISDSGLIEVKEDMTINEIRTIKKKASDDEPIEFGEQLKAIDVPVEDIKVFETKDNGADNGAIEVIKKDLEEENRILRNKINKLYIELQRYKDMNRINKTTIAKLENEIASSNLKTLDIIKKYDAVMSLNERLKKRVEKYCPKKKVKADTTKDVNETVE